MNTPVRVAGFVAALGAAFGLALGVGYAVGPVSEPPPTHDAGHNSSEQAEPASVTETPIDIPGGLMISQSGYTLRLSDDAAPSGRDVPVSFTVEGPNGDPVTAYDVEHEKRLHLIAVRRDFSGFQHVHPKLDADGLWSTDLDLTPGQWRLFADFAPTGADPLTLGADLQVAGRYQPRSGDSEVRTARVDDYTVTLTGDLEAGADAELTLTVERFGRPVTDLQPYLGAYGHMVALREGDLAYLHVHPDGSPGDGRTEPGPEVVFYAAVPTDGGYRLFLDFKHDGVVRTAAFRVAAGESSPVPATEEEEHGDDDAHEH